MLKFRALLYGFYVLLRVSAQLSAAFHDRLKEKDLTLTIKTADNRLSRSYTFINGAIFTQSGAASNADFVMIWKDAPTGARTMLKAKNGPAPIMKAVNNQDLKLEGDAAALTWFVMTLDKMKNIYIKK